MTSPDRVAAATAPTSGAPEWASRFAVGSMVFLGAFLSFSMEPIVGRLVTPFFGGAVHVWTVSLMIFQALLLAGYLYAHWIAPRIGAGHLLLLLVPLLQWPLGFTSEFAPQAPIAALVAALLAQISLPFAMLSTTAVVAQSWWYSASSGTHRSAPYFLYGVSNLGAMVALFAYPFLVEPLFGTTVQRWAWSIGYLLYAGITVWTWAVLRPRQIPGDTGPCPVSLPAKSTVLRWLALSAAPAALLLAVTNVIAMEIGSFPLVWVFPLALYLTSFIVTFREQHGSIVSSINFWLPEIALLALIASRLTAFGIWALPLLLLAFYALCVMANERLYRLRPHPRQLTVFYLTIAFGGWIGGMLVSLVAPQVFSGLTEYPLAVLAVASACWPGSRLSWWRTTTLLKGSLRLALLMLGGTVLGLFFWYAADTYALRNFYGISRIIDQPPAAGIPPYRMLVHGATMHGLQYRDPERSNEPLGYYYTGGALEQAAALRKHPARVAMIGLGAGTTLPWFQAGETVTIFEIDADMEKLARNWFSYLKNTPAQVRIQIGDARLNLADETKRNATPYDTILIDAFSGDGIPTHLLTLEALDTYLSRLSEDGVLVFHVSSRYYDLRPILKAAARARKLAGVATMKPGRSADRLHIDPWVVALARRPERLQRLLQDEQWAILGDKDGLSEPEAWTDQYINVLAPLFAKWLSPPEAFRKN